jgi:hypothetical protein
MERDNFMKKRTENAVKVLNGVFNEAVRVDVRGARPRGEAGLPQRPGSVWEADAAFRMLLNNGLGDYLKSIGQHLAITERLHRGGK